MAILLALFAFGMAYASCVALVRGVRRRTLPAAAVLGAALLICLTALVVHALSIFHAVGRSGLLLGYGSIAILGAGVSLARSRALPRFRLRVPVPDPLRMGIAAVGMLALLSALAYRPNNWDSMTYHLARVAYWIQDGTIAPYPTSIPRQVSLPPGAEYLLLVLQAISGSERLAALVQFGAWLLIGVAAPVLARSFGASRAVARWSVLPVAAAPMAILQASSTQNDLVAAVTSLAIVFAALPFVHPGRRRWHAQDLALLIAALTAGVMVKPTGVIVTAPLLLVVGWTLARCLRQRAAWASVAWTIPAFLLVAGCVVPVIQARAAAPMTDEQLSTWVYTGAGEVGDRLLNSVRGVLRNIPVPLAFFDRIAPARAVGCERSHSLCLENHLALNEDFTGNVGPALVLIAAVVTAVVRRSTLSRSAYLGVFAVVAGWILFHATFRDNVWITRLQLPLFALAPAAFGGFSRGTFLRGAGAAALWVLVTGLSAHAALAATVNARRPLVPSSVLRGQTAAAYYLGGAGHGAEQAHDAALVAIDRLPCRRLGMFIGSNSFDYPLAWRAMLKGIEVRHVVGPNDWACAVFSDRGTPPARRSGEGWKPMAEAPSLYVSDGAGTPATTPAR